MLIVDAGTATLVGGTAVVSTTAIRTASKVMFIRKIPLGAISELHLATVVDGVSFVITSLNTLDNSVIDWFIMG